MNARIAITETGKLALFIDEGTPEAGKQMILSLLGELQAAGLEFESVSPVERHRHELEREGENHERETG